MTDLAAAPLAATTRMSRSAVLFGCLFVAAAAGAVAGRLHAGDTALYEDRLVLLLRFMAVAKAAGVLGAAALVAWRIRRPLGSAAFAGYVAALCLMALAPGLIMWLGPVAVGALVFHAGFLAFLVLAARDDGIAAAFDPRRRRA